MVGRLGENDYKFKKENNITKEVISSFDRYDNRSRNDNKDPICF